MFWLLIIVALQVTAAAWAIMAWGWPAIAGLLLLGLPLTWAVKRSFRQLILMPFRAKGAVLRGAVVNVNGFKALGKAAQDEGAADFFVELDLSVKPAAACDQQGGFQFWEPHSLQLYPAGSRFDAYSDESEESLGDLQRFQIWLDGRWVAAEGDRLEGSQRLLCVYQLARPVRSAALRYYLEDLGELRFI